MDQETASTPLRSARRVQPGSFLFENHFYPKVLNAPLHPLVTHFMNLSNERIIARYCHLHPAVIPPALERLLSYTPTYFHWGGCDLMNVTTVSGMRQMVVIETNSCPSGQKSMPLVKETDEQGGYRVLMERSFLPLSQSKRLPEGGLAVIYDKNPMENTGYAATMADVCGEPVWLAEFYQDDPDPPVRFDDGVMLVRDEAGQWHPIRAAHRYVTQRPWSRIPPLTRTAISNPVLACLAGGRNKLVAAKAYDLYNADLSSQGLAIRTPSTIRDVLKVEIPLWLKSMGGHGVIKVPYSNAGQGVYTVTSQRELDAFMAADAPYDQFIVQSLIGNVNWSSRGTGGQLYHVGTVPNAKLEIYVADLRMMVCPGEGGFRPVAMYARRTPVPLVDELLPDADSWAMLGTNLSIKLPDGSFTTDPSRLLPMDRKSFNLLGLGLDDLIEGFIQTVLSVIAIDKLAGSLITQKGRFRRKLYASLNADPVLLGEIIE
ncbi:MAG: hypothetical protein ABI333_29345 [bacterium]